MKRLCFIPYLFQVIEDSIPRNRFVKVTDRKPPSWAPTVEIAGSLSEEQCTLRCNSQEDCVGFTFEEG